MKKYKRIIDWPFLPALVELILISILLSLISFRVFPIRKEFLLMIREYPESLKDPRVLLLLVELGLLSCAYFLLGKLGKEFWHRVFSVFRYGPSRFIR